MPLIDKIELGVKISVSALSILLVVYLLALRSWPQAMVMGLALVLAIVATLDQIQQHRRRPYPNVDA